MGGMTNTSMREMAARVIGVAHLGQIRLVKAACHLDSQSLDKVAAVEITHSYGGTMGLRTGERFTALAAIETTVSSPGVDRVVAIEATFELSYRLPEGFEASDPELSAFAEVNAVFNAWPYFREFLQSVTGRMLVPPIVLPLYRLTPPAASQADSGATIVAEPPVQERKVPQPRKKREAKPTGAKGRHR